MPKYEIEYICNLSDEKQDELAEAITKIHAEKFNVPRLFVNVSFKPEEANAYIAGKRRKTNHIVGHLRTGPSRTRQDYDDVSSRILKAWEDIVGTQGIVKLGSVILFGGLLSACESGLRIPPAGEEPQWIRDNFGGFQEMAKNDEMFQEFVDELQTRECFKGLVPTNP